MATILKCKMCGGDISVNTDMSIGTCQYCGSSMTIPHIDSDKKARLFNWANQLRLNNEFDKAYDAYREIVAEDTEEAEAYWGMLLSEYGVEYVEDPKTKKRVPTCHRTIEQSIKNTANYEMACKYADIEGRFMYKNEADTIDRIQKKIKSISSQQEQYDVFICYKESEDSSGERTEDSVLAQDIYDELCKKGINTFFSRITLKDKLGEDYEPYIYSALKSAKVMLVVATSAEHYEAPWVRNEWSRFLTFMSEDSDKKIIPVYKHITAYELPDELSSYQAQDLEKIGAIQDLVLGIETLLRNRDTTKKTMSEQDVISILNENKRREREAKAGSIKKGMMVAAIGIAIIAVIIGAVKGFNYLNKSYFIPNKAYNEAIRQMKNGGYDTAAQTFDGLKDFKKSEEYKEECRYLQAMALIDEGDYEKAMSLLIQIPHYKDSQDVRVNLSPKVTEQKLQGYAKAGEKVKLVQQVKGVDLSEFSDETIGLIGDYLIDSAEESYAIKTVRGYTQALEIMSQLSEVSYKDSVTRFEKMQSEIYKNAAKDYDNGHYDTAKEYYELLAEYNYADSEKRSEECDKQIANEENTIREQIMAIAGTWKKDDNYETIIQFMVHDDNTITYIYKSNQSKEWSSEASVGYHKSSGVFSLKFVSKSASVWVNGNSLTVDFNDATYQPLITGTYNKVE